MTESRPVPFTRILSQARNRLRGTSSGHEQKIQHVGGARAAQMSMAEAHDRAVGVVIAGAPIPPVVKGIWTKLHHAEGNSGARIRVPMASGADRDLHVLGHILRSRG